MPTNATEDLVNQVNSKLTPQMRKLEKQLVETITSPTRAAGELVEQLVGPALRRLGRDVAKVRHDSGVCGCSLKVNPNNCIYQPFLDGWDFSTDVGHGSDRGEIFTPRFIVDKMIVDGGLMPAKAVYQYNYKTRTKKEALGYINAKVNEPAVGTGNFTATILWHKIEYANAAAMVNGKLDQKKYDLYVSQAVASMYSNDIDCGNLQTLKWRLLRLSEIYADFNMAWWIGYIEQSVRPHKLTEAQKIAVQEQVHASMSEAGSHWGVADEDRGVLDVLYKKHTARAPSESLKQLWVELMDSNIKLFNGIAERDSLEEGFVVAGWHNIEWSWWTVSYDREGRLAATAEAVPLAVQIQQGQLAHLVAQREELELRRTDSTDGLVSVPTFASKEESRQYQTIQRAIEKQRNLIAHLRIRPFRGLDQQSLPISELSNPSPSAR